MFPDPHTGRTVEYAVVRPDGHDGPLPVIINLHGARSSRESLAMVESAAAV